MREMGVESKNIMPLPWHDDDIRDDGYLIRTEMDNLCSSEWWRSLGIDGVVLYSWGAPRYTRIARAVHRAGIRLHVHLDGGDSLSLFSGGILRRVKQCVLMLMVARHLSYADVVTMGKPIAALFAKRLLLRSAIKNKVVESACPVAEQCRYDGREKEDRILCVGRWSDENQKRSRFLMRTLELFYASPRRTETEIYGKLTDELEEWHRALPIEMQQRIKLVGYIDNAELWERFKAARSIVCPSRFEGSHNVSAEMLCCGGSVITTRRDQLLNVMWYTEKNSGIVAEEDTPEALATAIAEEMQLWNEGKRNPAAIAAAWHPSFHVPQLVKKIFPVVEESAKS